MYIQIKEPAHNETGSSSILFASITWSVFLPVNDSLNTYLASGDTHAYILMAFAA
jgi:hypothetical protein